MKLHSLNQAMPGDRVKFHDDDTLYTVRAKRGRYLIATGTGQLENDDGEPTGKQANFYTIVDFVTNYRGPENLVFGAGCETDEQVAAMMSRLFGEADKDREPTEISRRNRAYVRVDFVTRG